MAEKVIFEIEFDAKDAEAKLVDLEKALLSVKAEQKELRDAFKAGAISADEFAKRSVELKQRQKELSSEQRALYRDIQNFNKATKSAANSYDSLIAQYNIAKKRLNELEDAFKKNEDGSIELTEEFENQKKVVEELRAAIIEFDQSVKDGRTNVGNYADAMREVFEEAGLLIDKHKDLKEEFDEVDDVAGQALGDVSDIFQRLNGFAFLLSKEGMGQLTKSFLNLGKVLLTNPIFIIAAVLIGIYQALKQTKAGTEAITAVMDALGAVLDTVIQAIRPILEALAELIKLAAEGVNVIADFIGALVGIERVDIRGLQTQFENIEKQIALTEAQAAALASTLDKLNRIADDSGRSYEQRLVALRKAVELQNEAETERLLLLAQQVSNLEEQLRKAEGLANEDEIRQRLAEKRLELMESELAINQRAFELKQRERELLQEELNTTADLFDAEAEYIELTNKSTEAATAAFEKRLQALRVRRAAALQGIQEDTVQYQLILKQFQVEELKLMQAFEDGLTSIQQEEAERRANAQKAAFNSRLAALQTEIKALDTGVEAYRDTVEELEGIRPPEDIDRDAERLRKQIELLREQLNLALLDAKTAEERIRLQIETEVEILKLTQEYEKKRTDEILNELARRQELELQQRRSFEEAKIALQEAFIARQKQLGEDTFAAEVDLLLEKRAIEEELLREKFEQDLITEEEFRLRRQELALRYETELTNLELVELERRKQAEQANFQARLAGYQIFAELTTQAIGELLGAQKEAAAVQKVFALFEALLGLQQALTNENIAASKLNAAIPGAGEVYRIQAIARVVAQFTSLISAIRSQKFAEGGFTGKGFDYRDETGFRVAGVVHEGEYVIPKRVLQTSEGAMLAMMAESMRLRGYATGGFVGETPAGLADLANVFTKMPPPVVRVEDIRRNVNDVVSVENKNRL